MCRGPDHVDPQAQVPLASLLADMASALAFQYGTDAASVLIGPVDFGDLHES